MQHFLVQSRIKKAPDFVGRNRRAVGRDGERGRGKGKEVKVQDLRKGRRPSDKMQVNKRCVDGETVQISKKYLDRLLLMTAVAPEQPSVHRTQATEDTACHMMAAHRAGNGVTSVSHIQPGPQPGTRPAPSGSDSRLAAQQCPSSQEPRGLSWQLKGHPTRREQVRELATRREQTESQARRGEDPEEEYFPWGRPGGGAPLRSISGTLLTNYCTRGRAVENMRSSNLWQPGAQWRQSPSEQPAMYGASNPAPLEAPQPPRAVSSPPRPCDQTPPHRMMPHKSQFARGLGPHVDSFVLSQRHEQRRKELSYKEELAAQIAERKLQREAERHRKDGEEREAEERVRREIEEMNKRSEVERERRQLEAEEQRVWQTVLQARIQEAEDAARREKQRQAQQQRGRDETSQGRTQGPHRRAFASRIPLPTSHRPPPATHSHRADDRAHPATTRATTIPHHRTVNHSVHTMATGHPPSPPLPAVARALAGKQPPSSTHPPHPPFSPIVPALAKKLALQQPSQPYPLSTPAHPHPPPDPPPTSPPLPAHRSHPHLPPDPPPISPPLPAHRSQPDHTTGSPPSLLTHLPPPCQPQSTVTLTSSHKHFPTLTPSQQHLPTLTHSQQHLPTLTPSQQHTGTQFPRAPPDMVARQQTILHQLAILREGILSQRKSVDTRLTASVLP